MSEALHERPSRGFAATLGELLEMIKFQHALFALPFAFTGMLWAARGLPTARQFLLIVACMVAARTAAMTWNRIADRDVDARNPRTRDRALPRGRVSTASAWALLAVSAAAFLAASAALNRLTLVLAPVALAIVLGYSLAKRFTWSCHFMLGLSLSLAPIGAWIGVRGSLDAPPLVLGFAVGAWTAGFDLLYACQDVDFDRSERLHSLPARFGVGAALRTSRALHAATALALVAFGLLVQAGAVYFVAVGVSTGVLAWAQSLVRENDLSRVGIAFFHANVAVGLLMLTGTAIDLFI